MERWTFDSQNTRMPLNDRPDNLHQPVADDGGERSRNWAGHTRASSLYTKAVLHPRATAATVTVVAAVAIALRTMLQREPSPGRRYGPRPILDA